MANNYSEILNLVNAGNQMGLSNTIKRDYGIPLDFTSVQESLDEAVKYAATSTLAYVGQPIAVGGKLYIITDSAAEKYTAADGAQYDNYLAEVGSATEGDEASISLNDGVLSIAGFTAAAGATLPQKQADGSLKWVGIDAIVEGDGNTKSVVNVAEGSAITVTPVYDEESDTYTYTLDVTLPDVYTKAEVDELIQGVEAEIPTDYVNTEDYQNDKEANASALADRYTKTESDEKFLAKADYTPYDDTAVKADIQSNTEALATKANSDDVYDKTTADNTFFTKAAVEETLAPYAKTADVEKQLEEINSSIAGITHFETRVVDSEDDVVATGVLYLIKDDSVEGVDKYNEYIFIEGQGAILIGDTTTDLTDYVTNEALADAIAPFAKSADVETALADYAKTEDVETELAKKVDASSYEADKETFAVKDDVDAALAGKVDTATLDSYYTKEDVDGKGYAVANDVASIYATKQELTDHANTVATTLSDYAKTADVESELAKKIESGSISHTTDVVGEGVSVDGTELKIVVDSYTKAETLTKIQEKITEINGGESAGEVLGKLNSYIETNDARVGAVETKNTDQDTAISKAQGDATQAIADAKTANDAISELTNGAVANNTADISVVKGRLTTLETAKGEHDTRIGTLEGKVTALESADVAINEVIGTLEGNISALTNKDSELVGLISANTENITKNADDLVTLTNNVYTKADVYTKTEVDGLLANLDQTEINNAIAANTAAIEAEVERATAAEKANADAIATLVGNDTGMSAREIAADEVNILIGGANDADTITNVTSLIEYVNENGADVIALKTGVENNTSSIAGLSAILAGFGTGDGEVATVAEAINGAISAIPYASASVAGLVVNSTAENQVSFNEGVGTVNSLNVNKLVQTEGDTLIIHGGSAI